MTTLAELAIALEEVNLPFRTEDGMIVSAVTAEQMREVDRIAVKEFGLGILQMMENAGRNLAGNVQGSTPLQVKSLSWWCVPNGR